MAYKLFISLLPVATGVAAQSSPRIKPGTILLLLTIAVSKPLSLVFAGFPTVPLRVLLLIDPKNAAFVTNDARFDPNQST